MSPRISSHSTRRRSFRTVISSVVYLLEMKVRTFLLNAMCSNRVILTLEQQVDVLEELVRDNRVKVNFTLATNVMDNGASCRRLDRSLTAGDTASSRLPVRSPCIMLNFFEHQLNADSRAHTHIHTSLYLHTHTTLILCLFIKCSGYNCHHIILSFNVYVNISIL